MPRPKQFTMDLADADLTGFASNVTGASFTITTEATSDGLAHQVSIRNDSATDHSGKTVTLVGTDADNKSITEVVTGPGSSATVESSLYFKTLTSATPSATIGSDTFDIGWVDEAVSQTIPLNWRSDNLIVNVRVNGTVNYTVEDTFDDIQDASLATSQDQFSWVNVDDTDLVTATSTVTSILGDSSRAMRVKVNSYTDSTDALLEVTIKQAD